ncbi:MAG: LacI family transcriptional regulator [Actinobacteria bacterium]|nr:LacI family transcriptional regulator [Actinomycetota bacterium]
MVTIKDIARKAKVSTSTVSHVINGTHYVSEGLMNRIIEAMEEENYHPNLIVRGLRSKRTNTVGLILPEISDLFLSELARLIETLLANEGYQMIISNSEDDINKELESVRTLYKKMIDGILILPTTCCKINIEELKEQNIPVIFIDREISYINTDVVKIDNVKGCYKATEYLIGLGHHDICYIGKNLGTSTSIERENGFKKAINDYGLSMRKEFLIKAGGTTYENSRKALADLLNNYKYLPTAVVTEDDKMAIGAIRAINDFKLKIPDDISIIGFDDNMIDEFLVPRLSTVKCPMAGMAETVVKILIDKIKNNNLDNIKKVILEPVLVIRESTGKLVK